MSPIFEIAILVMSVVIHEVSHGLAAYALGDQTAKYAGRLTLNPLPHVDLFGSVLLPLLLVFSGSPFLIGWAKPVPYNPYNLSNQKWGPAIVGAAGPLSNITLAVIFGLLVRFGFGTLPIQFLGMLALIVVTNIGLAVFNMVPIPPLDGSKVLFALLPYNWYRLQQTVEAYGFVILIFFIVFFSQVINVATFLILKLIGGNQILQVLASIWK